MTYVITGRCVDCPFTYCVAECPANCFYEVKDPAMLVIHPDECVDCDACVPLCPINAIWPGDDLPSVFAEWTEKNAELAPTGVQVTSVLPEPLETAKLLDEIQADEQAKGLEVTEPASAEVE